MDKEHLAKKLRERRELLGFGQEYMGAKLNITQPGYWRIEKGRVKFTPRLLENLKAIANFADFDTPSEVQVERTDEPTTLASRWPWDKFLLYVLVILVGSYCLDKVFSMGEDLYRGFTGNTYENQDMMANIAVIYFVLGVGFIYWFVFRKKW